MNKQVTVRVVALAAAVLLISTGIALAVVRVTRQLPATVNVQLIAPDGIQIYLDAGLAQVVTSIDFGTVEVDPFGTSRGLVPVSVWIQNQSLSGIELTLGDDYADADVVLEGTVQHPILQPDEVLPAVLTLDFHQSPIAGPRPFTVFFHADGPVGGSTFVSTFWTRLASGCTTRGGHLRVGHRVSEFTTLNPATINQVIQFEIAAEVLSGLTQLDPDLNPAGDVAESWAVSGDMLTYTFKIRDNVRFHTGRPLTAGDIVFTYDHTLDPATGSIHTKGLEGVNRPVKLDNLTVSISTAFPRASFLTKVTERGSGRVMTIVDKETLAQVGEGGYNLKPVGTGPFRITDHVFGDRLELEAARDTFYDPSVPCLDLITMFNIPDFNILVAALTTGELDMIRDFAPQSWDQIEATPGVVVDSTPDVGFQMIAFNMRADRDEKNNGLTGPQPWDDINVVHAVGKALDRTAYINQAFQGSAVPAYGPIPPGQPFFFEDLSAISPQAFDLTGAQALMAASAVPNGFEFQVLTSPDNQVPVEAIAAILKQNINVTLIPDIQPTSIRQPRTGAGEFQATMGGSGGDPDPDDSIDDWFACDSKFNNFGYCDPVVDELNAAQKRELDREKRKLIVRELNLRISDTFHGTFTHHRVNATAYRDHVRGFQWIHAMRQLEALWLNR